MAQQSYATDLTARQILDLLAQHRSDLEHMGVRSLGLFGSSVRDEARDDSDIDLLLVQQRPSFDQYMDVKLFLEDLFGRRVDLVFEESLKPRLRDRILGRSSMSRDYRQYLDNMRASIPT